MNKMNSLAKEDQDQIQAVAAENGINVEELIDLTGLDAMIKANNESHRIRSERMMQMFEGNKAIEKELEDAVRLSRASIIEHAVTTYQRRARLVAESEQEVA